MAGTLAALAPLAQAGIGVAGSLFGNKSKNNPGKVGAQQLAPIPQYGYNAYNPFIQQGQQVEPGLMGQYNQMAYNPVDTLRGFESQYTERPGYKYMFDKLNKAAGNTAAAGGFLGTDEDVRARSEMHAGLLDAYMQNYLNNIFNIQGKGLSGLENRAQRGYEASGNLADYLGGVQGARAQYAGYGAGYGNDMQHNAFRSLANLIDVGSGGKGYGNYGGYSVGGGFNPGGGYR